MAFIWEHGYHSLHDIIYKNYCLLYLFSSFNLFIHKIVIRVVIIVVCKLNSCLLKRQFVTFVVVRLLLMFFKVCVQFNSYFLFIVVRNKIMCTIWLLILSKISLVIWIFLQRTFPIMPFWINGSMSCCGKWGEGVQTYSFVNVLVGWTAYNHTQPKILY